MLTIPVSHGGTTPPPTLFPLCHWMCEKWYMTFVWHLEVSVGNVQLYSGRNYVRNYVITQHCRCSSTDIKWWTTRKNTPGMNSSGFFHISMWQHFLQFGCERTFFSEWKLWINCVRLCNKSVRFTLFSMFILRSSRFPSLNVINNLAT